MDDRDGWLRVLDGIHDGMAHSLNGRLAGIGGLAQVARLRGDMDEELLEALDDEARRLEQLAFVAARLPRHDRGSGSVASLAEAVAAAAALQQVAKRPPLAASAGVDAVALRIAPDDLTRCLLLVASALEPAAGRNSQLEVSAAEAHILVRLTEAAPGAELDARALAGAQRIAASAGGSVTEAEGGAAVEMALPRAGL